MAKQPFVAPSFEFLWKEEFVFRPEVPLNWKEADSFKRFASYIYECLVKRHYEDIVKEEYTDGVEDGANEALDEMQKKVNLLYEGKNLTHHSFVELEDIINELRKNVGS